MKKGKMPFIDDMQSPKLDPLHTTTTDFPYDEIDQHESSELSDRNSAAEFVCRVFAFVTKPNIDGSTPSEHIIGRRMAAIAWVINPSMFEGISAKQLCFRLRIKSPHHFYKLTRDASLEFGITNRGQDHAWNRGNNKSNTQAAPSQGTTAKAAHKRNQTASTHALGPVCPPPGIKESFIPNPQNAGKESPRTNRT